MNDFTKLKKPQNKKLLSDEATSQLEIKLNKGVTIMFSAAEKQELATLANKDGRKVSPYVRHILKKHGYI